LAHSPDRPTGYWQSYLPPEPVRAGFAAGTLVLDVGCGEGDQLRALRALGYRSIGIEPRARLLARLHDDAVVVAAGKAEALPIRTGSVEAVLCNVVIPYTLEYNAIAEIGRVLKSGAVGYLVFHGAGYYLRYLIRPESKGHRFYAVKTLFNTWYYRMTRKRLPGWLGDTVYQSPRRLRRTYAATGLEHLRREVTPSYMGLPVFIADHIRRR